MREDDDVIVENKDNTVDTIETTSAKPAIEDAEFAAAAVRFMKALGRRASMNVATLASLAAMSDLVDELLRQAVHELRAEPVCASWAQIGEVLGITRQGAQLRFGGTGARKVGGQRGDLR